MFSKVVFPAPLRAIRPTFSPSAMPNELSWKSSRSPKLLVSLSICKIGVAIAGLFEATKVQKTIDTAFTFPKGICGVALKFPDKIGEQVQPAVSVDLFRAAANGISVKVTGVARFH